jgi:hypothetical protein
MKVIANVVVGKPAVSPASPAHVRGVHEGNQKGNTSRQPGLTPRGNALRATMRRSTGINPDSRAPIDPRMPVLTPA